MKNFFSKSAFFVLILLTISLYADDIRLKDGSILKGKIIQVTADSIEFDPEGPRPFDVIPRNQIAGITYEDGTSVKLADTNKPAEAITAATETKPNEENNQQTFTEKQNEPKPIEIKPSRSILDDTPVKQNKNFIDFEWGFNGYVGLGPRLEFFLADAVSLNCGMGLSYWGLRTSAGTRLYLEPERPYGLAMGIGISYSSGLDNYEYEYKTVDDTGAVNPNEETVVLDFKPVWVANITVIYFWQIFDRNRFYVESGYGIRLTKDYYEIKNDKKLADESKEELDFDAPGGFILTLGFSIAI